MKRLIFTGLTFVFWGCLPSAVVSDFPNDSQITGKAIYSNLALDSGTYYNPADSIGIRVIGLKGAGPCQLQKPSLLADTGVQNLLIDWPIDGELRSDCAYPSSARDTLVFFGAPAVSAQPYRLYSYQKVKVDDKWIYQKQKVTEFNVAQGKRLDQVLNLQIDSTGHVLGLSQGFKLVKIPRISSGKFWTRWKIRTCEVEARNSCNLAFQPETTYITRQSPDTLVIDTLERLISKYCPANGLPECKTSIRDSLLSESEQDTAQQLSFQAVLLDSISTCLRQRKNPKVSQLYHDFRIKRFNTPQKLTLETFSYVLEQSSNCGDQSIHGIWLDSNRVVENKDSLLRWWNQP